jgi:alpha-galactosidase
LVPPEILGSHIGSGIAHTTGRRHELEFRATTAMFGHMGIEWNLNEATEQERADLAQWIALYKEHRGLLHSGEVVRLASPDPQHWVHGVVSADRRSAIFASTQLGTSYTSAPGRTRFVGLDPEVTYEIAGFGPNIGLDYLPAAWKPQWWGTPARVSGRMLMTSGVQLPAQRPEHTVLVSLRAV